VAIPLAARYGVPVAEADDIVTALRAITSPRDQPLLHYWITHPDILSWPVDQLADHHLSVCDVLLPGFRAVIADHIEFGAPVVLEGDYLPPELVADFGSEVRAVVLHEPEEHRIDANFRAREPGEHGFRARVSVEVGNRFAERAAAVGVPVVRPWPWSDGLDRVDTALRQTAGADRPG
jgi:2-phosphoglycerate kinase